MCTCFATISYYIDVTAVEVARCTRCVTKQGLYKCTLMCISWKWSDKRQGGITLLMCMTDGWCWLKLPKSCDCIFHVAKWHRLKECHAFSTPLSGDYMVAGMHITGPFTRVMPPCKRSLIRAKEVQHFILLHLQKSNAG